MHSNKLKQIFTVLLITVFVTTQFSAVFAEETSDAASAKETVTEETEQKVEEEKKDEPEEVKEEPAAEEPAPEPAPEPEAVAEPETEEVSEESAPAEEPKAEEKKESKKESTEKKDKEDKAKKTKKSSGKSVLRAESKIDNSTSMKDGLYTSDKFTFTFTGGTGKAKLTCDRVVVENGKATAVFNASSENMTHVYLGKPDSDKEDAALYDAAKDQCGTDVYKIENKQVTVPVILNQETDIAARTTAMSEPHWVAYKYTITISEKEEAIDNGTTIKDGTYKPDAFSFTGGTGKAKLTCGKVIIKDGRALAVFTASSENMTHAYMGKAASSNEDVTLYDPVANKCGTNVYPITAKQVTVPVQLNKEKDIAVRTTAMSEPHWVNYEYKITLSDSSEKIDDGSTEPVKPSDDPKKEDSVTPSTKQKLSNGTYKVKSTTDRKMFYLYPKETDPAYSILVVKGKKMTATITLTGDGYDYVYMGTPAQAKAAGKSNWIKGKIVNGYYTFTIPVSALDKKLTITPHSKKYANDNDPSTEPWRPDKWIIFYSAKAVKVKDGTSSTAAGAKKKKDEGYATSGKQTKFKNDKKKDKVSKWKDDSSGSTHAVNNKTTLKDGVYTPDSFSWSGGSGRLAYIRCNKITVTGGRAYATIEFGSSKYDSLRANGRVYSKSGGGNSKFVIPVKLNANNTIIGRTTAMSSPHWVKYNIYVGKAETKAAAKKMQAAKKEAAKAKVKLTEKAPEIPGLTYKSTTEVKYAKYFKLFNYEQGVHLLSVDLTTKTALKKEYTENAKQALAQSEKEDDIEYDEEGNIIAKSDHERIEALYHNNVINYLLVPEKFEVPAGLEKEYIIITVPAKSTYAASHQAIAFLDELEKTKGISLIGVDEKKLTSEALKKAIEDEKVLSAGSYKKPEYAKVLKAKTDLTILPASALPEEIKDDNKSILKKDNKEELEKKNAEKKEYLERSESRFTALDVPVLVDRSSHEESKLAKAEWIKVYGAIYNCEDKADKLFKEQVEENK